MTEKEIKEALGGLSEDSSIWKAFMAVISNESINAMKATAIPNLTTEQRHFNAGRLSMALDLGDQFINFMEELKANNEES